MMFYIGAETTMLFGAGLTRGQIDQGRTGIGAVSTCFRTNRYNTCILYIAITYVHISTMYIHIATRYLHISTRQLGTHSYYILYDDYIVNIYIYNWIGNKFLQLTSPSPYKYINSINKTNKMTASVQAISIIISKLSKIMSN